MTSKRHLKNAKSLFETFHLKKAGVPVYPRHREAEGNFELQMKLPPMELVGEALRVMYRSDKWEESGDTHDYYHDHKRGGRVGFWLPCSSGEGESFPYDWPDAVTLLGECTRWFYREDPDAEEVIEGVPSGCILVASPKGFVSALSPSRVFLAIVDSKTGNVECLVEGDTLRLTKRGIEG